VIPKLKPAEAMVAAMGIEAFLRGDVKLTRTFEARVQDMAATIDGDVFRAIKGDRQPHKDPEPFNFKEIGQLLADTGSREQQRSFHDAFLEAPPALSAAVQDTAGRVIAYLNDHYPRRARTESIVATEAPTSGVEMARFKRIWRIACDPLSVIAALASSSMSRDMVQALSDLYPSVYAAIRVAVLKAIGRIKGRRSSWAPTRDQDLQLRVLMQANTITPQLAAEIATIPAATKAAQARTQHQDDRQLQTQSQRIATPAHR
jgi:hypothetical protein